MGAVERWLAPRALQLANLPRPRMETMSENYTLEGDADAARIAQRVVQLDPGPGAHLWVMLAAWYVANPREPEINLDRENLLSLNGPGCYKCEQPFSKRLAKKPCRGPSIT